jgi:hypothetical protein
MTNKRDWTTQILSLSLTGNQRNWGRYWRKPGTWWRDTTIQVRPLTGTLAEGDQSFGRCYRDGKTPILSAVSGGSRWGQPTGGSSSNTHESNCDETEKKQIWSRVLLWCCFSALCRHVNYLITAYIMMVHSWQFILSRSFHRRVRRGEDIFIWGFLSFLPTDVVHTWWRRTKNM